MSWNYHVPYQEDFLDRNPRTKEDAAFDKLDAQGVLHVVQRAMASETEKASAEQFHKDEQVFRKMYAAYRDTEHNARTLRNHWETVLGVTIPTFAQIEESFFATREAGLLQLDPKAVARENEEAILRRAAEIREQREAAEFNEADAYTMSLEELEARCRGWK
jgi:hypothetical protein